MSVFIPPSPVNLLVNFWCKVSLCNVVTMCTYVDLNPSDQNTSLLIDRGDCSVMLKKSMSPLTFTNSLFPIKAHAASQSYSVPDA